MRSCDKEKGRKYVALVAQVCEYCTVVIIPSSLCPLPTSKSDMELLQRLVLPLTHTWQVSSATLSVSTPFPATSYLQQIHPRLIPPRHWERGAAAC
ncbi:hypothetical protein Pmani_018207 [Petrolisthes manimaculis]|uniref:Uncharacterized protein n=1 Tax=Petrolisthes manimaculis TaxID=1843537 RepID=A0AAE1PKP6_9EUCA|nr:hypothetical protein Pmani_019348 [Petrolisthes manimaculis]KAK4310216.1 hypothetical protein Pmani_018207 [Petrolisthes manimaculis]